MALGSRRSFLIRPSVTRGKKNHNKGTTDSLRWILLSFACLIATLYALFAWNIVFVQQQQQQQQPQRRAPRAGTSDVWLSSSSSSSSLSSSKTCTFRNYPPHRFYKLHAPQQPDFLQQTEYIYGVWPVLLPVLTPTTQKLCVDQSSWRRTSNNTTTTTTTMKLPFADGTNPSILSMQRYRNNVLHYNMKKNHIGGDTAAVKDIFELDDTIAWMATVCMTNSQCYWKDSTQQQQQQQPDTIRSVLLLLTDDFETVQEATIYLQRDAPYGKGRKQLKATTAAAAHEMLALDDARLFVHNGQLWISYREGKLFGYDAQVLNPLHLEFSSSSQQSHYFRATIKASETTLFCCGRNMALMEHLKQPESLLSLTWVDPITVIKVDTTPLLLQQHKQRRLLSDNQNNPASASETRDRLAAAAAAVGKTKKSHIHGTNAFMVYLKHRDEFLGVAHFHRPNDRNPNDYARFGHHYTHAFYTTNTQEPFLIKALSPEWVLPAAAAPAGATETAAAAATTTTDAEIIQFVSGLEWDPAKNQIVLAYGINDCEGAIVRVDMAVLEKWLRPVLAGQQVVDFMQPPSL